MYGARTCTRCTGPCHASGKTIKDARSATSKNGLQRERPRPPVRRGRMAPSAPPAADFSPPRGRKAPSAPPATEFLPPFLWQNRNRLTVPSGALCFAPRFYILAEKDCKGFSTANLVAESSLNTPTDTAAIVRQFIHLPLILLLVRADAGQDYDLIHTTRCLRGSPSGNCAIQPPQHHNKRSWRSAHG